LKYASSSIEDVIILFSLYNSSLIVCLIIAIFATIFQIFWSLVLKEFSFWFHEAPRCILDETDNSKHGGRWFPGALLNIAECCLLPTSHLRKMENSMAIVWKEEGADDLPIHQMTLKELREQVMYADFTKIIVFRISK
jgi:hypothetical protein